MIEKEATEYTQVIKKGNNWTEEQNYVVICRQ